MTDGNTFLENAIGLVDGTELYKMSPTVMETADLTGYDLYIFDGTLPDEMPTDGGIFVLNPPDGNSFIETDGTKTINGYATGNTELSADGALSFALSQTKNIVRPSWAVTELSADGTPVIIRGENNGQRICVFSFDLHDSELPLMKDFPVMIYNLADYFLPSRSGTTSIYCGQKLNTAYSAAAERITVTNTEGEERTVAPPFPSADYSDTQQPRILYGFCIRYGRNGKGISDGSKCKNRYRKPSFRTGRTGYLRKHGNSGKGRRFAAECTCCFGNIGTYSGMVGEISWH